MIPSSPYQAILSAARDSPGGLSGMRMVTRVSSLGTQKISSRLPAPSTLRMRFSTICRPRPSLERPLSS